MMCIKALVFMGCAAAVVSPLASFTAVADDAAPAAAEAPVEEMDPELANEIHYVEALIEYGYPDFAEGVIAATKKKWTST